VRDLKCYQQVALKTHEYLVQNFQSRRTKERELMDNDMHPEAATVEISNSNENNGGAIIRTSIYDGLYSLALIFATINAACATLGLKSYIAAAVCAFAFAKRNRERLKSEEILRSYPDEGSKVYIKLYLSISIIGLSSIAWPLALGEDLNVGQTLVQSFVYAQMEVLILFFLLMFAAQVVIPDGFDLREVLISRYADCLFCARNRNIATPEEKAKATGKMSELAHIAHYLLDDVCTLLMLTLLVFVWVWLGAPSADRILLRGILP
jgi:hypothetical protein